MSARIDAIKKHIQCLEDERNRLSPGPEREKLQKEIDELNAKLAETEAEEAGTPKRTPPSAPKPTAASEKKTARATVATAPSCNVGQGFWMGIIAVIGLLVVMFFTSIFQGRGITTATTDGFKEMNGKLDNGFKEVVNAIKASASPAAQPAQATPAAPASPSPLEPRKNLTEKLGAMYTNGLSQPQELMVEIVANGNDQDVDQLIEALSNPVARDRAAWSLKGIGPPAIKPLIRQGFASNDPCIRKMALDILVEIANRQDSLRTICYELRSAKDDESAPPMVRRCAESTLLKMLPQPMTPALSAPCAH